MAYEVEKLTESLILGEGPHWDQETESLYFVDIFGKSIHKYTPSTKSYSNAKVGDKTVSFIVPLEGRTNEFVISSGNELALIEWDGKSDAISNFETLVELPNDVQTESRWNDAKVDSSGRLWAGVMYPNKAYEIAYKKGNLHSLNLDRSLKHQFSNITVTNGLAWNDTIKKFYYIDSHEGEIYQFDYDAENATITNQKVIFTFEKNGVPGFPDGMTIDTDGNLWVASFNGFRVVKIDPRRPDTLLQTIAIPAKQVTSVAFGGPNLDVLYVTTAKMALWQDPCPEGPEHGALYRVTGLGVKGLNPYKAKI